MITTLPTNDYDACLDYCFYQDKESTFYYDDVKLFKRCYNLTSLCCPECALEFKQNDLPVLHAFNDEEELKKHLHDKHNKYICSLCLEHTKLFPYQLSTYTIYVCGSVEVDEALGIGESFTILRHWQDQEQSDQVFRASCMIFEMHRRRRSAASAKSSFMTWRDSTSICVPITFFAHCVLMALLLYIDIIPFRML